MKTLAPAATHFFHDLTSMMFQHNYMGTRSWCSSMGRSPKPQVPMGLRQFMQGYIDNHIKGAIPDAKFKER